MKRALITGATGFVGANLARRLLADGHEVHLLARRTFSPWRIEAIRADVQVHVVELTDSADVARLVGKVRPEWIFHLATHGAYSWQTDAQQMVQTNIAGTINLVEACLKCGFEAFINSGSSSEYGFKDHAPCENEPVEPNSYYAITKVSATHFCRYLARSRGASIPTLRLYSAYGPFEDPTRLLPKVILHGLRGQLPPLADPDIARDYVYVEDVVDAYLSAASRRGADSGAIYNVGTGIQTTLREVVEVARRVLEISAEPHWGSMPNRSWDTTVWVADPRKISAELNWRPRYTFEQGFRMMADWFRQHPELRRFYEHETHAKPA